MDISFEAIKDLIPPYDKIAMTMIVDEHGQKRPLTEHERLAAAAAWGYRMCTADHLSCEQEPSPVEFSSDIGYTILNPIDSIDGELE